MKPITSQRLRGLAAPDTGHSGHEEQGQEQQITEPLLRNGMSVDFRAFVEDDGQINSVLDESLALLD